MEKRLSSQSANAYAAQPASVFTLPDLLPANMRLLLDPETHTAILLSLEGAESLPLFRSVPLTPASASVFLTLLQAYPLHCSHRSLYRSLYPSPESDDDDAWWGQVKDLALPMVRRALKALLPALRICGLQVVSLRGQGYILASATMQKEDQEASTHEEKKHSPCFSIPLIRAPCLPEE
jgi:biotin operon repressor